MYTSYGWSSGWTPGDENESIKMTQIGDECEIGANTLEGHQRLIYYQIIYSQPSRKNKLDI